MTPPPTRSAGVAGILDGMGKVDFGDDVGSDFWVWCAQSPRDGISPRLVFRSDPLQEFQKLTFCLE